MVHTSSAIAFAVVALNVASTMANPIYDTSNDIMEREFTDFDVDLDAREYDEFDAREFTEFEARELFQQLSELDARDYDEIDAREYEEVYNYLRAVSSTTSASSVIPTSSPALTTITKTKTYVPKPTACTQSELKAKKLAKKIAQEKAKQAKKAKAAARRAKKLLEKKAKKDAKKQAKNAKKGKHSATTSTSSTSTTFTSITSTSATSTSSLIPTPVVPGSHRVAAAHITPAPNAKAAVPENVSRTTITGKYGTVTVRVTTTAAQPACTRAGKFKKLFKHKLTRDLEGVDDLFVREYDFDQLD